MKEAKEHPYYKRKNGKKSFELLKELQIICSLEQEIAVLLYEDYMHIGFLSKEQGDTSISLREMIMIRPARELVDNPVSCPVNPSPETYNGIYLKLMKNWLKVVECLIRHFEKGVSSTGNRSSEIKKMKENLLVWKTIFKE